MRLDRLLAITMILMNRKKIPAKELAQMFEVSPRTIYRDIEAINLAGIPIVSYPGLNGGIGIVESFKLDKNVWTQDELASITVALQSVSSSYRDDQAARALEKIKTMIRDNEFESFESKTSHLFIDYSPWDKDPGYKERTSALQEAALTSKVIRFTYRSANGEVSRREAEPHTLVFKGQKWYLYAYCRTRDNFRLFKVIRMKDIEVLTETFRRRNVQPDQLPWEKEWHDPANKIRLILKFQPELRGLAEEWFDPWSLQETEEGAFVVEADYPESDWLYGFILGFGDKVEVIAPDKIRRRIRETAAGIVSVYEHSNISSRTISKR